MHRMIRSIAVATAAALACAGAFSAEAKTLRWSSQGDYLTADPMAQNELLTNSINGHVYESLVMRGKAEVLSWIPKVYNLPLRDSTVARLMELYNHTDPRLAKALVNGLEMVRVVAK